MAAQYAKSFDALLTSQRASGVTLNGGKVYFYEPGTTTLKTIYTTRAKTAAAANPYTLSSDGTAQVYGDGLYDVKVTNSALVQKAFWEDVELVSNTIDNRYTASGYATINAAVTAIGSTPATLVINTAMTCTADTTVPTTMSLEFQYPGSITISSGKTLTINGKLIAGRAQIFIGSGTAYLAAGSVLEMYPEWWGAKGDGTTDDTTPLTSAFSNIERATLSLTPNVTYIATGAIASIATSTAPYLRVRGNGATIDTTAADNTNNNTVISLSGALVGDAINIADCAKGDMTLTATIPNIATGSMLMITSTDLFNAARAIYYKGEIKEVQAESSGTITLTNPMFDAYTGANTTAQLIHMPVIEISDLTILRAGNNVGIKTNYTKNLDIRNVTIQGARFTGIQSQYNYGGGLSNIKTLDTYYSGSSSSYGVEIGSSQFTTVRQSVLAGGRHALSFGGAEPNRYCTVDNVTAGDYSSTAVGSIDIHGNAEFIDIINSKALGGLNIVAGNVTIRNSKIIQSRSQNQAAVYFTPEISSDYFILEGNDIVGRYSAPVWVYPQTASITIGKINILRNRITDLGLTTSNHAGVLLSNPAATPYTVSKLSLRENDITQTTSGFRNVSVNATAGSPITITDMAFFKNNMTANAGNIYVLSRATNSNFASHNDKLVSTKATERPIQLTASEWANVRVDSDHLENTNASGGYRLDLYATGTVRVEGNHLVAMKTDSGINIGQGTLAVINNNTFSNCTGTVASSAYRTVALTGLGGKDNVMGYYTAAPVTGVWVLGDRAVNSAGVVGQAKAWQCTTAGGAVTAGVRGDLTAYAAGVWKTWATGTTAWECTTAGTTAASPPSIVGKVVGDTVTDGSVVWTMRSTATAAFTSEGNL